MNPIIGIVVPIYNVEKYLRECLDSLIHQTYKNLQIVLVNDGSTDESLEIAKEYLKKDSRFILIDKENGGLSSARNTGIEFFKKSFLLKPCDENCFKVIGDNPRNISSIFSSSPPPTLEEISYLFFVDSDDLIDPHCLELYLKNAQEFNLDLVVSGIDVKMDSNVNVPSFWVFKGVLKNQVLEGEQFFNQASSNFFCSAWNVLIDFNFFKRINLNFIDGIIYEDCAFGSLLFLQAKRVMLLDERLYIYTIRKDGITRPKLITQDRLVLEFKSWYSTIKAVENFHLGKEMIRQHIKNYYLPMLYACAFKLHQKRYFSQCEEFQYMSFRIFLARYFPRIFLFLRKARSIYKRVFKIF